MPLTDSLVAFWELEESSGDRTDSVASIVLTDNNTVTSTTGKVGTCAQFTAANSEYLSKTDIPALSMGDIDFTVQVWAYFDSKSANQVLMCKYDNTIANSEYLLYYDSAADRIKWTVYGASGAGGTTIAADTFGAINISTWYCVHAWHNAGTNTIGIAVNLTSDTTSHTTGTSDTTSDFVVGLLGGNVVWYMDGRLDQMGIWKRDVGSTDRSSLYNSGSGLSYAAMGSSNSPTTSDLVPQFLRGKRSRRMRRAS